MRATRVPPIAAVREGATLPEGRFHRFRGVGAAATALLGLAALLYGLFGSGLDTKQVLVLIGLGALLIFIGVALFSAHLVVPMATALGWPATRIGGAAGVLARENSQRNPQRTASTAAALMIGLALVTLVATLAAGIIGTFNSAVDDLARGEFYAITAQNNFSPIPISAVEGRREDARAWRPVASVRAGEASVFGNTRLLTGRRPDDRQGDQPRLDAGLAGGSREPRRRRRVRRRRLREEPRPRRSARTFVLLTPTGKTIVVTVRGHLQAAGRWLAVRAGDDLERDVRQRTTSSRRTSTRS